MAWWNQNSELDGARMAKKGTKKAVDTLASVVESHQDLLFENKRLMKELIQKNREDNIKIIAEQEYEFHRTNDVAYSTKIAVSELDKLMAGLSKDETKEKLMEMMSSLSLRMKYAKAVQYFEDRDEWKRNRVDELMRACIFPATDAEALLTGGYAIPFPDSLPPVLDSHNVVVY